MLSFEAIVTAPLLDCQLPSQWVSVTDESEAMEAQATVLYVMLCSFIDHDFFPFLSVV